MAPRDRRRQNNNNNNNNNNNGTSSGTESDGEQARAAPTRAFASCRRYCSVLFLFSPLLFVIALWALCWRPDHEGFKLFLEKTNFAPIAYFFPSSPASLSAALANSSLPSYDFPLLESALRLPNNTLTNELIDEFLQLIASRSNGAVSSWRVRLLSFLSMANFLWGLSILGIFLSVVPTVTFIFYLTHPILKHVYNFIFKVFIFIRPALLFMLRCIRYVLIELIPVFELALYGIIFRFILNSYLYSDASYSFFLILTGLALVVPLFIATLLYHSILPTSRWSLFNMERVVIFFLLITLAPTAILTQSSLLGFLAVVSFFHMIGFVFLPIAGGYLIGFENRNAMLSVTVTSALIMAVSVGLRINQRGFGHVMAPFQFGCTIFGSLTLGLAGLIQSSRYYPSDRKRDLILTNAVYFIGLLAGIMYGSYFLVPSVLNTSATFLFLYLTARVGEYFASYLWPLMMGFSLLTWKVALWLNQNPEFLVKIFDDGEIIMH